MTKMDLLHKLHTEATRRPVDLAASNHRFRSGGASANQLMSLAQCFSVYWSFENLIYEMWRGRKSWLGIACCAVDAEAACSRLEMVALVFQLPSREQ